jgi:hypothetical protein
MRRGHSSCSFNSAPYGPYGSSVASVIVTLEELIYKYKSLRASVFYSAAVRHTACLIQKTLPHGLVPPFTEQLFAEWAETNCAEPVFQVVRIFG